jgi:hypothetical protein
VSGISWEGIRSLETPSKYTENDFGDTSSIGQGSAGEQYAPCQYINYFILL